MQPFLDVSSFTPVRKGLQRGWSRVLDVLMPPQCLRCGRLVERAGTLCVHCWPTLRFIDGPMCDVCGVPFEVDLGEGAVCGQCAGDPPAYGKARAAVIYDDGSKPLILGLKNADRTDAAPAFGRWMARAGSELLAGADVLVPVPLHWTRLFARRYNQAALLAFAVGRVAQVPVAPDVLIRRRRTQKLGHLSPSARRRMVQGAIGIHRGRAETMQGQRMILIDDVHTTGATLNACSRALLEAGAGGVEVLTLARTVRADPDG